MSPSPNSAASLLLLKLEADAADLILGIHGRSLHIYTDLPAPAPDQLSLGFDKVESEILFILWPRSLRLLLARFQFVF